MARTIHAFVVGKLLSKLHNYGFQVNIETDVFRMEGTICQEYIKELWN